MPLHIAIDARRLRDFGIGTYVRSLIHALAGIDRETRYSVILRPEDMRTLSGLPNNFETAAYQRRDSATIDHAAFPLLLNRIAPDLVHIPLNRVPLLMMRPYVVTIHDMANLLFEQGRSGFRMQLRRYRFRRGLMRARCVITVSDATQRDIENQMGVPRARIRRVYNAPDPGFFTDGGAGERARIMERYQIRYPFLLYAGNVRLHKNVPRLVEAFAVLRDQLKSHPELSELRLVIIGDTVGQSPAVRQAVIKSRVEHAVRFLGFVPFETLRAFYESAAVFVFPSRYEGFGLPPIEAMACGAPVVASNVSSLPEVLGDAAILVNPENVFDIARGVKDALLDDELRRELIERGRAQAARFSWERTAREVLEIYKEAGNRHG